MLWMTATAMEHFLEKKVRRKKKKESMLLCNSNSFTSGINRIEWTFLSTNSFSWTDCVLDSFMEIYLPMKQFFHNLIHPEYSAVTDVYVLMFLADTVDFIIIVFGYAAFGVRLISQFSLSFPWARFNSGACSPFRNTRQGTSRRLCQRTRFRGLSWSWCWSSLGPWWWTVPSTSGSLSWGRSSFRSSCSLESTSGCSSSFQESQTSKKTNSVDQNDLRGWCVWTSVVTSLWHQSSIVSSSSNGMTSQCQWCRPQVAATQLWKEKQIWLSY